MNVTNGLAGKIGFVLGAALCGMLTGLTTLAAEIAVEVPGISIHANSDFYEPLSSYGRWEAVGSYGQCWIPGGVEADWCPYANGYWQDSDAGWYWVSDEPWSWATYHYGRWDSSPQLGWYWVPQTEWAPAWVSWREGGGYVGWAPLNPSGGVVVEANLRGGGAPGGFVFVQERQFLDPVNLKVVIANKAAFAKTANNKGPATAAIEKATGRKLQRVAAVELRGKEEAQAVAKHPALKATNAKAVQTPVRNEAEKPAATKAASQPPAVKSEVRQPEPEKRGEPDQAPRTDDAKPKAAAPEEAKPEEKRESKPAAERPAASKEGSDPKAGKEDEK